LWSLVKERLRDYPAQLTVARTILELGLRIGVDRRIYCGAIEMTPSKIAKALAVDRRVVGRTVESILADPELKEIYTKLSTAGPSFKNVADRFGFGFIEIEADPGMVGIVAAAASLIAKEGISIRQVIADDPELYPRPKLTLIIGKEVPGRLIPEILKIEGVEKVSIS